jgi:hypothetical protein
LKGDLRAVRFWGPGEWKKLPLMLAIVCALVLAVGAEDGTGQTEGPVERAYEKVSPEDKDGGDTHGGSNGHTGFASPSGDAVVYTATQPFGDAQSTLVVGGMYRALRQPTAWASSSILPPKDATASSTQTLHVDFVS